MTNQRRSNRTLRTIPLALTKGGETIQASTAVIGRHGALILTPVYWSPGVTFVLRNQNNEALARAWVIWAGEGGEPGLFKLGIEFLEEGDLFWGADYSHDEDTGAEEESESF